MNPPILISTGKRIIHGRFSSQRIMSDARELPNRYKNSSKNMTPNIDRLSLIVCILIGIISFPLLSEETEKIFPGQGDSLALFFLIIFIPIIATTIGKTITRIRVS